MKQVLPEISGCVPGSVQGDPAACEDKIKKDWIVLKNVPARFRLQWKQ